MGRRTSQTESRVTHIGITLAVRLFVKSTARRCGLLGMIYCCSDGVLNVTSPLFVCIRDLRIDEFRGVIVEYQPEILIKLRQNKFVRMCVPSLFTLTIYQYLFRIEKNHQLHTNCFMEFMNVKVGKNGD